MAGAPRAGRARVTREMVYARTRELAVQAGRPSLQISQSDYERARRELTGESEMGRQEAVFDAPADAPGRRAGVSLAAAAWENEGGRISDQTA